MSTIPRSDTPFSTPHPSTSYYSPSSSKSEKASTGKAKIKKSLRSQKATKSSEKVKDLDIPEIPPYEGEISSTRSFQSALAKKEDESIETTESSEESASSDIYFSEIPTDTAESLELSRKSFSEDVALEEDIASASSLTLHHSLENLGFLLAASPITDIFTDEQGNSIARESARLVNTKDLIVRQFNSKIDYIDSLIIAHKELITEIKSPQPPEAGRDLLESLTTERDKLKEKRDMYAKQEGTWASTNAPRFAFQVLGANRAKEEYMPVLGDLWMQSVEDLTQTPALSVSDLSRSAAITDFTHGRISLQELMDYPLLLKMHNEIEKLSPSEILRAKQLLALYDLGKASKKKPFVIKAATKKKLATLIEKLQKRAGQDYGQKIRNEDGTLNYAELKKIIDSRIDKLNDQILQDLFVHFQSKPVTSNHVVYGRTGLLDPTKKADKSPTGFINSERTQALDMEAIYEKLDGRVILFDMEDNPNKGPYIDKDGNIHMNKSFYQGEHPNEPVIIHAVFLNISAQNETANVGIQKAINDRGIARLEDLANEMLIDQENLDLLKELLDNPKSNSFERSNAAITLFANANNQHGYASVDCYGGKDRTGYAVALHTYKILQEIAQELLEGERRPSKELLKLWGLQLVSDRGVGARIIKHSTGYSTMKLTAFNLTLYHTGTLKGTVLRINDYYKGMKAKFGPKVIPELAGTGQLYAPFTRSIKE